MCTQRRGTRVIVALFILRVASFDSWLVVCEGATPVGTSTLVNCNEVGSQLPHRSHMSSCLKTQASEMTFRSLAFALQNV